jgi:uncharacterized membrane protein YkvA (DUF1232 family)
MLDLLETHLADLRRAHGNSSSPGVLREYLVEPECAFITPEMLDLPMRIPDFLRDLTAFVRREGVSPELKTLAAALFSYVFNPFDFIDDEEFGYLGFIDDALVLFYALQHLKRAQPDSGLTSTADAKICSAVTQWESIVDPKLLGQVRSYAANVAAAYSTIDTSVFDADKVPGY